LRWHLLFEKSEDVYGYFDKCSFSVDALRGGGGVFVKSEFCCSGVMRHTCDWMFIEVDVLSDLSPACFCLMKEASQYNFLLMHS
jgi:hypothetical protein